MEFNWVNYVFSAKGDTNISDFKEIIKDLYTYEDYVLIKLVHSNFSIVAYDLVSTTSNTGESIGKYLRSTSYYFMAEIIGDRYPGIENRKVWDIIEKDPLTIEYIRTSRDKTKYTLNEFKCLNLLE